MLTVKIIKNWKYQYLFVRMVCDDCDDDVTAVNYNLRWSKGECILKFI